MTLADRVLVGAAGVFWGGVWCVALLGTAAVILAAAPVLAFVAGVAVVVGRAGGRA